MRFLILNNGDSSVGLNGFEVTIEVEDKHEVLEETKEDFIEFSESSEKRLSWLSSSKSGGMAISSCSSISPLFSKFISECDVRALKSLFGVSSGYSLYIFPFPVMSHSALRVGNRVRSF